ncbi:hypothetical protein BJ742DRAFT_810044 [Cladochytrium replicatum]|nr:hypothetical protein BJ742DRAFT_810044 [Cladochytrium replicatum]
MLHVDSNSPPLLDDHSTTTNSAQHSGGNFVLPSISRSSPPMISLPPISALGIFPSHRHTSTKGSWVDHNRPIHHSTNAPNSPQQLPYQSVHATGTQAGYRYATSEEKPRAYLPSFEPSQHTSHADGLTRAFQERTPGREEENGYPNDMRYSDRHAQPSEVPPYSIVSSHSAMRRDVSLSRRITYENEDYYDHKRIVGDPYARAVENYHGNAPSLYRTSSSSTNSSSDLPHQHTLPHPTRSHQSSTSSTGLTPHYHHPYPPQPPQRSSSNHAQPHYHNQQAPQQHPSYQVRYSSTSPTPSSTSSFDPRQTGSNGPHSPQTQAIQPYSSPHFRTLLSSSTFPSKDHAVRFLKAQAAAHGFKVLVRTSKKDYVVVICNCGRRLKELKGERKRKRRWKTALTGCEWRVVLCTASSGDENWVFRCTAKMEHNHALEG